MSVGATGTETAPVDIAGQIEAVKRALAAGSAPEMVSVLVTLIRVRDWREMMRDCGLPAGMSPEEWALYQAGGMT